MSVEAGAPAKGVAMLDRLQVETLLARRFPGANAAQIAAAANAIMGLVADWEEVRTDISYPFLAREAERGVEFRILRRRRVPD